MEKKKTMKSKVIDFVRENGPQRFTDIQAFVYDTNFGEGSYKKGYRKERTYNYSKGTYQEGRVNTNRGYYSGAFSGPRPYFLVGGTEQLYKREDGLYDVVGSVINN